MGLAVVRDLREMRAPASQEELADFETDVLSGFVLARAAAGLADSTVRSDVVNLEQVRAWFGRPLWEMEPADADAYFGTALRAAAKNTRRGRAQALKTYFQFLELRHKSRDPPADRPGGRVPDRCDEPAARPGHGVAAHPAVRRPGGGPVRRVARRAGSLPQVRPDGAELRGGPADGRGGAAGERGPTPGPGRRQVGAGPVREAARPLREGFVRFGAAGADGPADQRGGADAAVVHRGRVGPLRRRLHPARRAAVPLRAQEPGRQLRPSRR